MVKVWAGTTKSPYRAHVYGGIEAEDARGSKRQRIDSTRFSTTGGTGTGKGGGVIVLAARGRGGFRHVDLCASYTSHATPSPTQTQA